MKEYLKHSDEEEMDIGYSFKELRDRDNFGWRAECFLLDIFCGLIFDTFFDDEEIEGA